MKLYTHLFAMLFCAFTQAHAQVNLNDGLIGCYPFSGNAQDLSGTNNHGNVSGAKLAPDRFGNANSAYSFDGIDDYIEISSKDLIINTYTYSMWVKPARIPGLSEAAFLFSVGSAYGDQHILLGNNYTQRLTGFAHGSYQGVAQNTDCTPNSLPELDKWYHLVLVKDQDYYYFYVNGKEVCSNNISGKKAFYGNGVVKAMIGSRNNYGQSSKATIDDIHLYNRPLSKTEVTALYNGDTTDPLNISLKSNYNSACAGDKIALIAETNSTGATFSWKINGVQLLNETKSSLSYTLPDLQKDYQINVEVEASTKNCFSQSPAIEKKTISVNNCNTPIPGKNEKIFIPSAFTPNNDNINDTWEIFIKGNFTELKVSVFNRWGEVIFQSNGYDTPWDGKYQGKLVLPGIYTYKISSKEVPVKFGELNIIY